MQPQSPQSLFDSDPDAPYAQLGVDFAGAMVSGDFARAHSMLSADLRGSLTVEGLQFEFDACFAYVEGPLCEVEVVGTLEAEELDPRSPTDAGWAYLTIQGTNTYGGLAIVVSAEQARLVVREVQWGRP